VVLTRADTRYPSISTVPTAAVHSSPIALEYPTRRQTIDVDAIDGDVPAGTVQQRHSHGPKKWPCEGIVVAFPDGKSHHSSYPFGMHSELSVPWYYRSAHDTFYIQAKSCQKASTEAGGACEDCQKLTSNALYTGIMDRIKHGTHDNTPLVYHGIEGLITIARRKNDLVSQLRMSRLNDSRKLLVKVGVPEDQKRDSSTSLR
jgi:hypothetical protein